jgi:hypothetical protein
MKNIIKGSALTPVLESVAALAAPAYGQEGGATSRLARDPYLCRGPFFRQVMESKEITPDQFVEYFIFVQESP